MIITVSMQASIELIERRLAQIPYEPVTSDVDREEEDPLNAEEDAVDPEPFRKALPRGGPWRCVAGCGSTSDTPGVCSACGTAAAKKAAEGEFSVALLSLPKEQRAMGRPAQEGDWMCGSPLDRDGRPLTWNGVRASLTGDVIPRATERLLAGRIKLYLITGDQECGKTSVACAVARGIVARGIDELVEFSRIRKGGRESSEAREPRVVGVARGLRLVSALAISPAKESADDARPALYWTACRSTVLILDNMGIEAPHDGKVGFAAAERIQSTKDVLEWRWSRSLPTIVTTPLTETRIRQVYGGHVADRIFKSRRARVIRLAPRGGVA